jgi:hypothetical protein
MSYCLSDGITPVTHFADGPNDAVTAANSLGDKSGETKTCSQKTRYNGLRDGGANRCWGSAHSGVVNFLIGDGTVHSFPITTNTIITYRLANVSDGGVVTLP